MRKLLLFLLLTPMALSQAVVQMISPPVGIISGTTVYGRLMLAGENQLLTTQVTGGTTNLGTWSCTDNSTPSSTACSFVTIITTHADGTHDSVLTDAQPYITVQTDAAHPGSCTTDPPPPQPPGDNMMRLISPVSFVLTFTSNESGSHDSVPYYVCGNRPQVFVTPFYMQLFQGAYENFQSWVVGTMDQSVTWSKSGPACADSTFDDTNMRDTLFTAGSTSGTCIVTATSNADPTASDSAKVYVSTKAKTINVTPNLTKPFPCEVDPSLTGTDYEVGPGQTYATPDLLPLNALAGPGNIVRIHPGVYHNYIEVDPLTGGTATSSQPTVIICGIPDPDTGVLPEFNGEMARGASWVSNGPFSACADLSLLCVWHQSATQYYSDDPVIPAYVMFAGLHVDTTLPPAQLVEPDGTTIHTWQTLSSCIRANMGSYLTIYGVEVDHCGWGYFTDFNETHNWGGFSGEFTIEGVYTHGNGVSGDFGLHNSYGQSLMQLTQENNIGGLANGSPGAQLKSRADPDIIRYNRFFCPSTNNDDNCGTRQIDMVDIEDWPAYYDTGLYNGFHAGEGGSPDTFTCDAYCQGIDTMGFDRLAGWQALRYDMVYGNYLPMPQQGPSLSTLHFNGDHGDSGIEERKDLYFYYNTVYDLVLGSQTFDTIQPGGNPFPPQEQFQRIWNLNNIIWRYTNFPDPGFGYAVENNVDGYVATMQSNLYNSNSMPSPNVLSNIISATRTSGTTILTLASGARYPASNNAVIAGNSDATINTGGASVSISPAGTNMWAFTQSGSDTTGTGGTMSTPINNVGTSATGWTAGAAELPGYDYTNATPVNFHTYGLSNSSVLITPTLPINPSTQAPIPGSPAIGAATTMTGPPTLMPVRLQMTTNGYAIKRQDLSVVGSNDSGPAPATISIAITNQTGGGSFTLVIGQTATAICTATLSDFSTVTCTTPVWSSGNTSFATINTSTGVIAPLSIGSSTFGVSANGFTTTAPFSVIAPPATELGASEELGFSVKVH